MRATEVGARRGASLIEVLLAFTGAAMVLVLVLNLFPSAMATVRGMEQRTRAHARASSLLESRAALPFRSLEVGYAQDLAAEEIDGVRYQTRLEVTAVDGENPDFLRALRVTVRWTERNRPRQVTRELWVHRLPSRL